MSCDSTEVRLLLVTGRVLEVKHPCGYRGAWHLIVVLTLLSRPRHCTQNDSNNNTTVPLLVLYYAVVRVVEGHFTWMCTHAIRVRGYTLSDRYVLYYSRSTRFSFLHTARYYVFLHRCTRIIYFTLSVTLTFYVLTTLRDFIYNVINYLRRVSL